MLIRMNLQWQQRSQYVLLWILLLLPLIQAASISDSNGFVEQDSVSSLVSSSNMILGVVVCLVVFLLVVVVIVPGCMDCMNSEVSSESHPACGGSQNQPKWGGAVEYTPVDRNAPAGYTTGEIVNLGDRQNEPLPYSMIPTQIPEASGFQGYHSIGDNSHQGVAGYSIGSGQSSGVGYGNGRHYNPAEPEEPPPSYGAAAYGQHRSTPI